MPWATSADVASEKRPMASASGCWAGSGSVLELADDLVGVSATPQDDDKGDADEGQRRIDLWSHPESKRILDEVT